MTTLVAGIFRIASVVLLLAAPGELQALESQELVEGVVAAQALPEASAAFEYSELPSLPRPLGDSYVGNDDGTLIVASAEGVLVLPKGDSAWREISGLDRPIAPSAGASTGEGLILVGGRDALRLKWTSGMLSRTDYPDLPREQSQATVAVYQGRIYVAGDGFWMLDPAAENPAWTELTSWPGGERRGASLAVLQDQLFLLGGAGVGTTGSEVFAFTLRGGWRALAASPNWPTGATTVAFGQSHVFLIGGAAGSEVLAYHVITGTLVSLGRLPEGVAGRVGAVTREGHVVVVAGRRTFSMKPVPVETGYNWIDHAVVGAYLLAMVGMGFFFSRRGENSADFFRGGNRIPWWASGMSLFATGASAISLMAMPGKAFAGDWTYLTISFYTVMVLPISMFFLAPLVRRLNIATANEYLEKRFGLVTRTFASLIFIFTQIAGRMASVMLLPAIALSAITGMSVVTCILIMGVITTIYTFFGGLEAVVWTDTVQGFIMAASIGGCLILVLTKLGMGPVEMWSKANEAGKFHMFDFSWDITEPTMLIFFIATVFTTLGSIGDQNFVQRVQCTPDMRQTRLAVGMQLVVAVPLNLLLFSLGTALYLFYRNNPGDLDPLMKTDGIYPYFVAQQLPPGLSGVVVAALFAATMSTISSSICSVSDLGVQDFYRRFNPDATDRSALILGRVLTAVVGVLGVVAAIWLSKSKMTSVWDLATLVIGLISSGIVGLYFLGLLTRRANEAGAVTGILVGLGVIAVLRSFSDVTFWLYLPIGSVVTFAVGYAASLVLPGQARNLDGLTIYTLPAGLFSWREG